MRVIAVILSIVISFLFIAQVQPPPPPNPPAPVSGGGFPPSGCVTPNGVIFNNATPCDAGLTKASGATGSLTNGGSYIGPVGSAAATTYNWGTAGTGMFGNSTSIQFALAGSLDAYFGGNATLVLVTSPSIEFGNGTNTYLNTPSAGVIAAGTLNNNSLGAYRAQAYENSGTVPTTTSSTCTAIGSQVGGNSAGSIVATCTAQNLVLNFATTAVNGWACMMQDQTTPADSMKQTANSATSVTFTGTTVASDVLIYSCMAF